MAIVSNTELQGLSDWLTPSLLTDSCAIQREVTASGASSWQTAATVPCAIVGPAMDETNVANEVTGAVLKRVLMPRNTDVRSPDRLLINGITYRVYDIKEPSTYEVLRRVTVTRFPQRGGA